MCEIWGDNGCVCVTYGGTMGVCDIWGDNGVCVRDLHLGHCEVRYGGTMGV